MYFNLDTKLFLCVYFLSTGLKYLALKKLYLKDSTVHAEQDVEHGWMWTNPS